MLGILNIMSSKNKQLMRLCFVINHIVIKNVSKMHSFTFITSFSKLNCSKEEHLVAATCSGLQPANCANTMGKSFHRAISNSENNSTFSQHSHQ